jgi:hypothetical protein
VPERSTPVPLSFWSPGYPVIPRSIGSNENSPHSAKQRTFRQIINKWYVDTASPDDL